MDAYETVRVIGYGSYGSAVLVRARVPTNSNTALGHGGGDATTQQQPHPQQPQQQQPHAPPSPPVGRQFVIKQIRLAALEHDSGRDEAGAAAQPSGPSVSVSVSVPPPSPLSAGLINEVQVLMRVGASRHPNICRYRDSFLVPADDGPTRSELLCIVMDYYAGGDLARKIRQRLRQQLAAAGAAQQNESLRSSNSSISSVASTGIVPQPPPPPLLALFSEDTVIDCLVQLALGLKHCHDQGVLHRDLKTSNIFISNEPARSFHPRPARSQPHTPSHSASSSQAQPPSHPPDYVEVLRIGDFGIARMLDAVNPLAHTRVGTPYSLAPEVCEGRAYSFEADMWSLGCVLYELLTGRHAFNAPSLGELVIAITRGTYGPVPNVYSSRIHQLLRALLQKDPERRPTVTQLLSVPFMRDRIPFWLSHRRILVEFGGELSRLPEFQLAPLFPLPSPMRSRSTSAHHSSVRPRESQSASSTSTAAAAGAGASGSRSGRDPTERSSSKPGPPCSLVIPPRSMLTAAASTTAAGAVSESATPSPMPQSHAQAQGRIEPQSRPRAASASSASSLLDRLTVLQTPPRPQPTQQRQPLTPPSTFSSGARHDQRRSPCAAPRGASSTASGSGIGGSSDSSAVGGVARVTTPISSSVVSSSSGHSRAHSSSTPSPLPVLRFHPLALTPLPLPQQSRPATPAVTAIDRVTVPSSSSDSHIAADSSRAPSTPSSAALVTVPSSVSSFAWRVPAAFAAALGASAPSSSASAAPPPPVSLSLQCERVRAWLEQQIQFGTLKRAYDLMREQSAEPPAAGGDGEAKGGGGEPHSTAAAAAAAASSSSRSAHDSRVLQVLQLSQTHLITLMQQLVQAERVQEEG